MVSADAAALESRIVEQYPVFRDGLVAARLQAQRRSCRVIPDQFDSCRQDNDFIVSFSLPAGSYATSVLAEIFSQLTVPA
jgi:tRNA pseudouridine13 synthase